MTHKLHTPHLRGIPLGIWALGLVSLFMDISSEMIHSLLPVFMVSVLGASAITVGFVEGLAEATAAITKVFSGALSDRIGRRKLLTVLGYGMAALTKPLFPLAHSVESVFAARFIDRIGKGIRGAPRDAMIGDFAPPELRGASFGLRQTMDTVGAFLGPLLAIGLLIWFANDIRAVFWVASIPAFIAVVVLVLLVREPDRLTPASVAPNPLFAAKSWQFGRRYWWVLIIGILTTLARFSEAFLILKAEDTGLSLAYIPIVLVVMNIAYAFSAYPAGVLSDQFGRPGLLAAGMFTLVLADLVLAFADGVWVTLAGILIWGLHMGLTQGVLSALIADAAPADLRGSAFGFFHMATGIAMLIASVLAGLLWEQFGPTGTFLAGGCFALATLVVIWPATHLSPTKPTG